MKIYYSSNGRPHGFGRIVYFTDDKLGRYNYTGNWANGLRHGKGIIFIYFIFILIFKFCENIGTTIFRNGDSYTGNYVKGFLTGSGKIK